MGVDTKSIGGDKRDVCCVTPYLQYYIPGLAEIDYVSSYGCKIHSRIPPITSGSPIVLHMDATIGVSTGVIDLTAEIQSISVRDYHFILALRSFIYVVIHQKSWISKVLKYTTFSLI